MLMSWIYWGILAISILCAGITNNSSALSAAVVSGAQAGCQLALSLAGSICLWSGIGRLMQQIGLTGMLSRLFHPFLHRIFPSTRQDAALAEDLSANISANLLGLGNAATPMGIKAARRMAADQNGIASHELCRLIVLNTASIQLIPASVAAIRANLGSVSPFDILPAVWLTSLCSAGLGLSAAFLLGKLWKDG